jgi:hypothetical protein
MRPILATLEVMRQEPERPMPAYSSQSSFTIHL